MKNKLIIICIVFFSNFRFASAQLWDSLGSGFDNEIRAVCTDTINNILYAGGLFEYSGSLHVNNIARWNGTYWDTLSTGNGSSTCFCGPITALTMYNGELYSCGNFWNADTPSYIAKWNGVKWDSVTRIGVNTLMVYNNELYTTFYNTGNFNGTFINFIAKYNGSTWSSIANDTTWNGVITSIIFYNGELYVAGQFYNLSTNMWNIAKWNGSYWEKPGNMGIYGSVTNVNCMAIYNNELYVGGLFTTQDGNVGNFIQKWNGTSWSDVGGGMGGINGQVMDLKVHNGKLYAAGLFTSAGGVPADKIAVWDGTNWCGLGTAFDGALTTLAFLKDTLYIAGMFYKVTNNDSINSIAKWIGGTFTDTCGNTSGINENNFSSQINIYPNPTTGIFTITSTEKISSIKITNIIGEEIYSGKVNSEKEEINLSNQSKGFYFIKLISKRGITTQKIILQ